MDRLDKEIMLALFDSQQSMYGLEKTLKETGKQSNYATVFRHIKKMRQDGLLNATKTLRKNGKLDKRGAQSPTFTPRGLATLIIDGDLQKEELSKAVKYYFQKNKFPSFLYGIPSESLADALLKLKPKVNLKFFNENYFYEALTIAILDASIASKFKITNFISKTEMSEILKNVSPENKEIVKTIQKICNRERDKFDLISKAIGARFDRDI